MKLFHRGLFVIPFLLILMGVFTFLLYRNLTKKVEGGDRPTVGLLTFKVRTIERKFDNQVVWETIPTQTEIKNRDTIRTVAMADAILTLEDGTQIQIGENSMILVDFSDKKYNLNFAYGTVGAKRDEKSGDTVINIQSGDSQIQVGKGELSLEKSGEELSVNVSKGEAKIRSGDKEQTVSQDQTAKLSEDGIQVKTQTFRLVEPRDASLIITETAQKSVSFSWTGESISRAKARWEISTDPGFRRVLQQSTVTSGSIERALQPGIYYWRLAYVDESGKPTVSSVSRFQIIRKESIRIFTPTPRQNFVISPGSGSLLVNFSWSKVELVSAYRVELSQSENFSPILTSKETKNNSIGFDGLAEGNYFVRVVGKSALDGEVDSVSEVNSFSISRRMELERPILIEPTQNRTILSDSIPDSGLLLSWKDQSEFSQYKLEISSTPGFENRLVEKSLSTNFFRWTGQIQSGKYFWRITGTSKMGESKQSESFAFSVTEAVQILLLRPGKGFKEEFPDDGIMEFAWKPTPGSGRVSLEVSRTSQFDKMVFHEAVTGSSANVKIPAPGTYYWRVLWEKGNEKVYSESQSFQFVNTILAPQLVFPAKNSTVDMTNRDSLPFSWTKVKNADQYQLTVVDTTGLKEKEIISQRLRENRYDFTDLTKLNTGKFRWEVKSLGKNPDGSFSESPVEKGDFFLTLTTGVTTKILTPGKVYVE